jgi:pimeloyl-ACP methyl ester carboxylesterase
MKERGAQGHPGNSANVNQPTAVRSVGREAESRRGSLPTDTHSTTSTWPGAAELQLDLFGDYKSYVALYPTFQKYFRTYKPPFLAVWGKNDPFFLPLGAEAFKRDIPDAVVRFFDTGHFALETHAAEIVAAIRDFLPC